jgi:hypothetical protein
MAQRRLLLALALSAAACSDPEPGRSYGDPTSLDVPSDASGIRAWVLSPATPLGLTDPYPEIVLGAYTLEGARPLTVELSKLERNDAGESVPFGTVQAVPSGSPGESQRFSARLALHHGENRVLARIRTDDGTDTRTLSFVLRYEGENPGATLGVAQPPEPSDDPCIGAEPLAPALTNRSAVCLRGRVTTRAGGTPSARIVAPASLAGALALAADGSFASAVDLPRDAASALELELSDGLGHSQRVATTVTQDSTPPSVRITSTTAETLDATYGLTGEAEDTYGIADVRVETGAGSRESLGAAQPFSIELTLAPGGNPVRVVARDLAGNEGETAVTLSRVRTLSLGAPTPDVGTTKIEVDRQALTELLTPEDQRDLELVSIDLHDPVRSTLERIRDPLKYGLDTSDWGDAERNLQRILQMTPDVADLSGTSVEELLNISGAVGLPAPRLLADVLALGVTDTILDLDVAADVIVDLLIGSHPNIDRDAAGQPVITVTLADVLEDLSGLTARFGPSGAHPGFLSGTTTGRVLESGFLITFPVSSNLIQFDAIDLRRAAKDYVFVLAGERVLDFNVLTDDFNVVGLVDEPTIDLRFVMNEAPTFTRAGSSKTANPDPAAPGFFRGNGESFAASPWTFEHIAAEAGYRQLHRNFADTSYQRTLRYDTGSIKDADVTTWDRGFITITTAGNIGSPPAPLYVWDLLAETAQRRLHDQGVQEGQGKLAFRIPALPVGLTADQLVDKLRPKLDEQEDKLSEQLAGKTGLASTAADVFYVPGVGGTPGWLVFRAEGDAGSEYTYPHVGFYADAALTQKLSSAAALPGVSAVAREQVAVSVGSTYYAADDDGSVHAIEVLGLRTDGLDLRVKHLAEVSQ